MKTDLDKLKVGQGSLKGYPRSPREKLGAM